MVDGEGDDWFHNGDFREQKMPYAPKRKAPRKTSKRNVSLHKPEEGGSNPISQQIVRSDGAGGELRDLLEVKGTPHRLSVQ